MVKALGTGIGFEVSRLDFDTAGKDLSTNHITRSTTLEVDGAPAPEWQFEETMLEDHCVAVATRPDKPDQVSGMRDGLFSLCKKKTENNNKTTTTTKANNNNNNNKTAKKQEKRKKKKKKQSLMRGFLDPGKFFPLTCICQK